MLYIDGNWRMHIDIQIVSVKLPSYLLVRLQIQGSVALTLEGSSHAFLRMVPWFQFEFHYIGNQCK
jgi:hypothetical protein